MNIFSILRTGAGAMQVARGGIAVASNNVANADTPGYARQRLEQSAVGTIRRGGLLMGQGVTANSITSAYDRFNQRSVTTRTASSAFADQRAAAFDAIEPIFAEGEDGRLGAAITEYFDSFSRLGSDPSDPSLRQEVLAAGDMLVAMFTQADSGLSARLTVADERVAESATQANTLLQQIGTLNTEIMGLEANGGEAGDFRAQRVAALDALAGILPVRSAEQPDGGLTVLLGGHALVQRGTVRPLTVSADPITGLNRVEIPMGGGVAEITGQITDSRLGSLLSERDTVIPDLRADLDALAFDLANAVNGVHAAGFGSDGVTGRNFFVAPAAVTGAAGLFAVDAAVQGNTAAIAAATIPGSAADNTGSQALAALSDVNLAGGGTRTFLGFYADIVVEVGSAASSAYADQSRAEMRLHSSLDVRDSAAGVSIEEEALDLLRLQDAYQAAGRVMSTANELMDELFRIV